MILVDSAALAPGSCIITGTDIGPFIDTGIDIDSLPAHGRMYVAVSTVEDLGQQVGMLPKDATVALRAEAANLAAEVASLQLKLEAQAQANAALVAAGYGEDPNMGINKPTPSYKKRQEENAIFAAAAEQRARDDRLEELEAENLRLVEENERLRTELDEAQLRSIEARNPGIDVDEVRRTRDRDVKSDGASDEVDPSDELVDVPFDGERRAGDVSDEEIGVLESDDRAAVLGARVDDGELVREASDLETPVAAVETSETGDVEAVSYHDIDRLADADGDGFAERHGESVGEPSSAGAPESTVAPDTNGEPTPGIHGQGDVGVDEPEPGDAAETAKGKKGSKK